MIRTIIIDDERRSRETLATLLQRYCPDIELLDTAESVAAGAETIRSQTPDLVFLDIEMPHGSGFDLLDTGHPERFEVIFTTAYDRYAIRAIKCSPLDYLMKPIDRDDLIAAVEKARKKLAPQEQMARYVGAVLETIRSQSERLHKVALPTSDGLLFIEPEQILRCEAQGNYTTIHLINGERILVTRTLKEFDGLLTPMNFFRVHNAHLINLRHVRKYVRGDGGHIIMSDSNSIEVSRRRRDDLMRRLAQP